jgi:hypothetical protein
MHTDCDAKSDADLKKYDWLKFVSDFVSNAPAK